MLSLIHTPLEKCGVFLSIIRAHTRHILYTQSFQSEPTVGWRSGFLCFARLLPLCLVLQTMSCHKEFLKLRKVSDLLRKGTSRRARERARESLNSPAWVNALKLRIRYFVVEHANVTPSMSSTTCLRCTAALFLVFLPQSAPLLTASQISLSVAVLFTVCAPGAGPIFPI